MNLPPALDTLIARFAPAWLDRALILKTISFAMIGAVNTVIDFAVFSLGHLYFGLPIIPANLISWSVAVSNSYVMNSKITFAKESGGRLNLKSYFGFGATQIGGLIANTVTVFALSYVMPVLFAKLIAIGASFMVDFTLSHLFVFRRREEVPSSRQETPSQ